MSVIEVKNLKKSYGKTEAVKGVTFSVEQGEIFGVLGPNGAGKTTIMEILEGLRKPDSGQAKIMNTDLSGPESQDVRRQIGVMLQSAGFFDHLTIAELLNMFARIYENSGEPAEILRRFELDRFSRLRFADLSGGQKQRFALATAVLHEPRILFLDEPTIGLDPAARQKFWDLIMDLKRSGLTVFLTTHYLEEAEILCDRVAIMDQGRIIASSPPAKLINSLGVISRIRFMATRPINVAELEALPGIVVARRDRYTYDLESETPEASLRELLQWEKKQDGKIFNLQVRQATLEDVFLKLTGHSLRE